MPNDRRRYVDGHPVFVTIVTHRRRTWLAHVAQAGIPLDSMRRIRALHPFRHLAHVIMPDHVHWIFIPESSDFSCVVGALKRDVTWRLKAHGGNGLPPYWQDRFYDHVIRDDADLRRHLDYVHFNPAKHGVARPAEYGFSSFGEWVRRGMYEPDWGSAISDEVRQMDLE